jgi:hypothetical protein
MAVSFGDAPWQRRATIAALPVFGFLLLILFGTTGVMRNGPSHIDMQVFYGAGSWYLDGVSPYGPPRTPPSLRAQNLDMKFYGYPPHFAPFSIALASLDFAVAKAVFLVVNLAAALALAAAVVRLACGAPASRTVSPVVLAIVAFVILASPFAAHVLWLGNTTLIVAASLAAGWWLARTGRSVLAGILFAVASLKPQFAALPLLWLLLERRWKTLAAAAATGLVLFAYHAVAIGPLESIWQWLASVAIYQSAAENALGYQHRFGVRDLLYAAGLHTPPLAPAAFILAGIAWWYRQHLGSLDELAILSTLTVLFLPVHDYDLVVLAPLAGAIAVRVSASVPVSAVAIGATALLFVPQRALRSYEIGVLNQWRVVVVLALLSWLPFLIAQTRGRPHAPVPDYGGLGHAMR